jgi:hypothetical protein
MKKSRETFVFALIAFLMMAPVAKAQETTAPASVAPALPVTAVQSVPLAIQGQPVAPEMPASAAAPAPATAAPADDWMVYKNPYVGEQNNLANPNRTKEEVTAWVQKVVMDALTFSQEDVNEKISTAKTFFLQQGWQEYAGYIKETKLLEKIRSEDVAIKTIANGDSLVLGAEAIDGTFHWIIETPLLITFTKKDPVTQEENTVNTGLFKSTIMVSRVNLKSKEDGIAIKGWRIDSGRR